MRQFFESYKDGNDMGRLEVVMRLEIPFFLVIVIAYIFMGLVLQVVNPFMPGSNKRSKKSETNLQLKTAALFRMFKCYHSA